MFAIMLPWQTPPMRRPKKQRQGSIHGLTRMENHKEPDRKPLDTACERQTTNVATTSWWLWTKANLVAHILGPELESPLFMTKTKTALSVHITQKCRSLGHLCKHGGPTSHSNAKKQCDNANNCFTYSPKRKTTHTLSVATTHQHWLFTFWPESTWIAWTCLQSWRLDKPLQSAPKFNNTDRLTRTSKKRITTFEIKNTRQRMQTNSTTKHISDHIVTALHKSNLGGTHPRAPKLEFQRFMEKQRCSLGIQHLRGSLGHVRNHGGSSQQSERHPSNHLLARAENHKHTEHKLHVATYNRIAQLYIVPNTSWRLKTKATVVAHILTIQSLNLLDTCASTHVVSLPSEFLQIAPSMFAIMSAVQSTQMRTRIPQWHKSMNAITQTENHKHPKQVSLNAGMRKIFTTDQSRKHIMDERKLDGTNLHAPTLECPLIRPHQKQRCSLHTTETSGLREHVCNPGDRQAILMQSTIWRWHPSIHTLSRTGKPTHTHTPPNKEDAGHGKRATFNIIHNNKNIWSERASSRFWINATVVADILTKEKYPNEFHGKAAVFWVPAHKRALREHLSHYALLETKNAKTHRYHPIILTETHTYKHPTQKKRATRHARASTNNEDCGGRLDRGRDLGLKPTWWHTTARSKTWVFSTRAYQRKSFSFLLNSCKSSDHVRKHDVWTIHSYADPNSTMTLIDEHTHPNRKPQASETSIARRDMRRIFTTDQSRNTSWTTETANSATHTYHRWSCFFLPNSLSQSWRLDNPIRYDVQFKNDKIASRENQNWSIANIQIKIRWTRHQNDWNKEILWRQDHDDSEPTAC